MEREKDWDGATVRIAIVHSFYSSATPSGENNAVMNQAEALREAGHEVEIIGRHTDQLSTRKLYELGAAARVATGVGSSPHEEIVRFSPDVVHVHNLFPNWGSSWMRDITVPTVATVHNFRPICAAGTLTREGKFCDLCPTKGSVHSVRNSCYRGSPIKTLPLAIASRKGKIPGVFRHAAAMIFLSERSRALYETYGLDFSPKSHVLPNFAEAPPVYQKPSRPLNSSYWIFVGRLSAEKGILSLVTHWPKNVELRVVGSGPDEQECKQAAVGKNISFHGQLPRENVNQLLQLAEGLVFPSSCPENSPLVYPEALALGLPVVALKGNAVADDIRAARTGIVVESVTGFSNAIERIERNQTKYKEASVSRYFQRFTKEVWVSEIEKIYLSLLS